MALIDRRRALKTIGAAAALGVAGPAGAAGALDAAAGFGGGGSHQRRRFVLLHGAWQNAAAWDGVAYALRLAGHQVDVPTLPGANPGDSQGGIEFADYVDAVAEAIAARSHKAIVVAHSSAGMLIQAAAPRVRHRLEQIVFCNAFIMANGQSQLDNVPADAAQGITALAEQNGGIVPFAPLEGFVRGALMEGDPVKRQDALVKILVDQPFSLFATPVNTAPFEALDVARAVLFCRRDHSADYLGMAARLGHYETLVADGSHEMLFSAPHAFAVALLTLVAAE